MNRDTVSAETYEDVIKHACKLALFEFNDEYIRRTVRDCIRRELLHLDIKEHEYVVICNEMLNTPRVIDNNGFEVIVVISNGRILKGWVEGTEIRIKEISVTDLDWSK